MTRSEKPIPEGYHTATPYLIVHNAKEAIEYYKRLFGAQELMRMESPDGSQIMHAELQIGDSRIFLSDEAPKGQCRSPRALGASTGLVFLYVPDVDGLVERARTSGANVTMPPEDTFWGDRYGQFTDPYGHSWGIATHMEDVAPEEIERRRSEYESAHGTA